MIPLVLKGKVSQQLITLHMTQFLYIYLYIKIDPHWRFEKRVKLTNEYFNLCLFISLLCQSEAVSDSLSKYNYGYLTCAIIAMQLGFNLVVMGSQMTESFIHQRNIK